MCPCKTVLGSLLMTFGIIAMAGTVVQAQSGNLEPPGSAVNGSGAPVATTQTQPSWDQVLPVNERFKLVMNGEAVLDKETGLVWEQSPQTTFHTWKIARRQCLDRTVGGRKGWRLPSMHELMSLIDPGNPEDPPLPVGHPFSNVQLNFYWSGTVNADNPTKAFDVLFVGGNSDSLGKGSTLSVWCVRGGGPLSEY